MSGKIIVSLFSALLVVGIVIGCVSLLKKGSHETESDLSAQSKSVSAICQPTHYKDECSKSLENVHSGDPKQLIKASVTATQKAVQQAHKFTDEYIEKKLSDKNVKDETKGALKYCKQMLDSGVEDLQEFLDAFTESDAKTLNDKFFDFWSWVSSTAAYQQSCLDDLWEKDVNTDMRNGMEDAKRLTSNAMAIVKSMNSILTTLGSKFNFTLTTTDGHGRRLLDDGYPSWMSGADRKLLAAAPAVTPDAIVAQDGSGMFKTITEALAAYKPEKAKKGVVSNAKYIIYVKAGTYNEQITIDKTQVNVFIYGDGQTKTIITNNKSVVVNKLRTSMTGTLRAFGVGFMAKDLTIANTAGPVGEQAVALQLQSDKAAIFNCKLDGYQDTLYVNSGRQFYRDCVITGTIDFIFGRSPTVIQNSEIIVRRGGDNQQNTVTADGKEDNSQLGGIVIQNSRIVPEPKLIPDKLTMKSYLGRPWKMYSTAVVIDTEIGDFMDPAGWMIWQGEKFHETCHFMEFRNKGAGASPTTRVPWAKVLTDANQVLPYTAEKFLGLGVEPWLNGKNVPIDLGLVN